jgi:subtilisin family serine protease
LVAYDNNVSSSGNALVYIRFFNPKEGIWKLRIYENSLIEGRYDIWLPVAGLINSRYEFVKSSPDTTLCQIANTPYAITVSGYNYRSGGIYVDSSRGYTFDERIKPDIAAPAVDINVINNRGDVMTMSGTSIASAITSGLVAMLFEWGIVNKNYRNMDGVIAKKLLIRGAVTVNGIIYPNKEWGYGKVNIYETFDRIRSK